MQSIEPLIKDFLAQRILAVAGVSERKKSPANFVLEKLQSAGRTVFVVHPTMTTFKGNTCYRDVASLPEPPGGLFIATRPEVTEKLVEECIRSGVKRIWMHSIMGSSPTLGKKLAARASSASASAVDRCRRNGISVIPGACPMMFCHPVDPGHACFRWVLKLTGALKID